MNRQDQLVSPPKGKESYHPQLNLGASSFFRRCYLNFLKRKEQCLNINTGRAQSFFQSPHSSSEAHITSRIPQVCVFRSSQYMEPYFFSLPRSEQPSSVVIYWINLKLLLSAWLSLRRQRFSWWELMLSCSMDGKKQEKKSTSYRFLETLADSSFPKLFLKVCVGFSSSFWPIILSLSLKSCYWMIQRLMQWQPQLGCLWIQICGCEAASKGHRPAAGHLSGPPSGRRGTVW